MGPSVRLPLIAIGAVALVAMSAPNPTNAATIVNGSFEADPFTGSGFGYRLGLSGNDVTGWFIPNSDGTYTLRAPPHTDAA